MGCYFFHNVMSICVIPPNAVSNAYNIYSPTGSGFGAHSCDELLAVDLLKAVQGSKFNYKSIVDSNSMIDMGKVDKMLDKSSIASCLKKQIDVFKNEK